MRRFNTLTIFCTFLVMGFADVTGTLVGFASKSFEISRATAGLLPFAGYIAFGLLSVPAGMLAEKKGKRLTLIVGLCIALAGMLLPVISLRSYAFLVLSILLLGSGMAVIQVAGNPLMRDVSAPGKYARNLSFAQFIKAIGSLSGSMLTVFVLAQWTGLFPVYAAAIALTLCGVWFLRIKESPGGPEKPTGGGYGFTSLRDPYILMMVLCIFLYVGAEVGVNSWIATYLNAEFGMDIRSLATLGIGFFLIALMAGRLLGSAILTWMSPKKFFLASSVLSCIGLLGLFAGDRTLSIASIFIIGLGFGNIFPLVFSILIDAYPERGNELSGLMIMMIAGGALMPLVMGFIADYSVTASFLIPLASLLFITLAAGITMKRA